MTKTVVGMSSINFQKRKARMAFSFWK